MKKLSSVFVLIFVFVLSVVNVHANDIGIKVMLDGQYVDVVPTIIEGSTLLPARDTVELLGGSVEWNEEKRQVKVLKGSTTILLTIDSLTAYVNGSAVELIIPPQIIIGKTMIPLRFVATSLGVDVSYTDGIIMIATDTEDGMKSTVAPPSSFPIVTPSPTEASTPIADAENKFTVFWGNTGDKIHISQTCRTIKNGVLSGSIDEAKAEGHTNGWCGVCSKDWTDERFLKDGNPNVK